MENSQLALLKKYEGYYITKKNSSINNWLGGRLISANYGSIQYEFQVNQNMLNLTGTLHGGIATAMMDDLMGITIFSLGETNFFASISMQTHFLRPVPINENVTVTSNVVKHGRKIITIEVDLKLSNGKIAAKSISDLLRTEKPLLFEYFVPKKSLDDSLSMISPGS